MALTDHMLIFKRFHNENNKASAKRYFAHKFLSIKWLIVLYFVKWYTCSAPTPLFLSSFCFSMDTYCSLYTYYEVDISQITHRKIDQNIFNEASITFKLTQSMLKMLIRHLYF